MKEIGEVETGELKERIGKESGGWGRITGGQEMKTDWKDGVGMEEKRGHGSGREWRKGGRNGGWGG